MTSFKKPFIAIATAVAIATTALVAAPANAAVGFALVGGDSATVAGTTEATAVTLPVPADNNVTSGDVLRIDLTGLANNVTVTATATDAKLTATVGTTVLPSAGTATATVATGTGTVASFNVFTTTTKTGKVVLSDGTNTLATYYVKGAAGALNTIALAAPTAALGTTAKVTVTGTDVFGNPVAGSTVALQVVSATATNTYSVTTDAKGEATKELTGLAVGSYDLIATATVATAVTGLATPTGFVRGTLKVVDLAALVAEKDAELAIANGKVTALTADKNALTAQVAELTAKLALADAAALGNKNKYNALATKWNKAHPKSKVALLK
jgi:hypothetical protein